MSGGIDRRLLPAEAGARLICVGSATRTKLTDHTQYLLEQLGIGGALPGKAVSGSLKIVRCP
jgi:hypothetical protein